MSLQEGMQLGNYRLTRLLGRGSFAEVYLAQHIHLDTTAAIKALHTDTEGESSKNFQREAKIIAQLRHPHIVSVLDFDIQDKRPFLVMDYAPGGPLHRKHREGEILPLKMIISYITQIGSAIQYAHSQNIIHRDIKPENIFIGRRGELLLGDFGIAKIIQQATTRSLSRAAGTTPYMAPEQIQGQPGPASDQYALGIIVYEWLCGTRPFTGTPWEVVTHHLSMTPPPLRQHNPTISSYIEEVILRALAKDPAERFATVEAFVYALTTAISTNRSIPARVNPAVANPPRHNTAHLQATPYSQPEQRALPQASIAPPPAFQSDGSPRLGSRRPISTPRTPYTQAASTYYQTPRKWPSASVYADKQNDRSPSTQPDGSPSSPHISGDLSPVIVSPSHDERPEQAQPDDKKVVSKQRLSKLGSLSTKSKILLLVVLATSTLGGGIFEWRGIPGGIIGGLLLGLCCDLLILSIMTQ